MFILAGCTGELQPLNVRFNQYFKELCSYVEEVCEAMDRGVVMNDIKVDLRATIVKPLHASLLSQPYQVKQTSFEIINNNLTVL